MKWGIYLSETEDQLQKLEERLLRAFELFKQAQAEKLALKQEIEKLRVELRERDKAIEAHEKELVAFRREREEVKLRVEKLLHRIDALTAPDSSG